MKKTSKIVIFLVALLIAFLVVGITVNAANYDEYAPILYFEGEETCYPVEVDYFLQNSELKNTTIEGTVISYYDVNDNIIESYQSDESSLGYTVYYYVDTTGVDTIIQYWMFYVFNPGEHNQHEGDWEMVQITISGYSPKNVGYSQHYSGQSATWDIVEKDGNHFKVYVSRGSHANYLRSYSGKLGIASDIVGDNGKVLTPNDYTLVDLNSVDWLDFEGLWGEINDINSILTGSAGPQGPKYRVDMNGGIMWNGASWSTGLLPTSTLFFQIEWFLYHFITILIIFTIIFLALAIYRINKRHKKYGLGPRIVSMLYIDGFNLHSIGNILCIIGIIIAILGLFSTWYIVSADVSVPGLETEGVMDIMIVNGMNGMQIYMPTEHGPVPMGSVVFPFALVLLIGFIFLIIATIGIHLSRKLGLKYLFKGVRLILVFVALVGVLYLIGFFMSGIMGSSTTGNIVADLLHAIGNNPIGGTLPYSQVFKEFTGQVTFQWGIGDGIIFLLIAGIVFIIAGGLEIADKKEFFKTKVPVDKKEKKPAKTEPASAKTKSEKEPENKEKKAESSVCPNCGKIIKKDVKFCPHCGKKV
jgi:hypothetical protein